jgi:hypothetical protein
MSDLANAEPVAWHLTLADQSEALRITRGLGGSGQGDMLRALSKTPLAIEEYRTGRPKRPVDASHLSRYDGTDFVVWMGRHADGYFRPYGRILQIVPEGAPHV